MIVGGLMLDLILFTQFYRWSIYGKSWRFPIALIMFYAFRYLMSNLFLMRYPDGYLWQFPGFYSVSVPYGMANNFFFCPQLGLCVIIACELHAMGCPKLALVTMFAMVY